MLISEDYRKQQAELHETGTYGIAGETFAPMIAEIMQRLSISEILDYGCGSRLGLFHALKSKVGHKFRYQAYDPAVLEYAKEPIPSQLVACCDVLEHVEPEMIDGVLDHLQRLTEQVGFFSICTQDAMRTLPDGRNAHILQKPAQWWLEKIMARFELQTFQVVHDSEFFVIVYPRIRVMYES